jgi:hypothetical protein
LVIVTVWGALVVPTAWSPKTRLVGEKENGNGLIVMVRGWDAVPSGAEAFTVNENVPVWVGTPEIVAVPFP